MRSALSLAIGLFVAMSVLQTHATAQAKHKAPAKHQPTHSVLGTAQLAGENGKLGVAYTLGKANPLNFTLLDASYSPTRIVIGNGCSEVKSKEKMLVIDFTVQNPQPRDVGYDFFAIKFTALDADGASYEKITEVGKAGTHLPVGFTLKPGQKIAAYTGFVIPANVKIVKLVADHGDPPVLRVNLTGHIKPLPALFADPADPTGATCLANIPGHAGAYYPSAFLDVRYDSAAIDNGPLGEYKADPGNRVFIATFTVKNMARIPWGVGLVTMDMTLQTSDGEKEKPWIVLKTVRNEQAAETVSPGDEYTARAVFQIPENVTGKSLTMGEGGGYDGKTYTYDVSAVK